MDLDHRPIGCTEDMQELARLTLYFDDEDDRRLFLRHGIARIPAREVGLLLGVTENTVAH